MAVLEEPSFTRCASFHGRREDDGKGERAEAETTGRGRGRRGVATGGQTTRGFRSRLTAEFPHKLLGKFADKHRNIL